MATSVVDGGDEGGEVVQERRGVPSMGEEKRHGKRLGSDEEEDGEWRKWWGPHLDLTRAC